MYRYDGNGGSVMVDVDFRWRFVVKIGLSADDNSGHKSIVKISAIILFFGNLGDWKKGYYHEKNEQR